MKETKKWYRVTEPVDMELARYWANWLEDTGVKAAIAPFATKGTKRNKYATYRTTDGMSSQMRRFYDHQPVEYFEDYPVHAIAI